jgi:hypothetical protein
MYYQSLLVLSLVGFLRASLHIVGFLASCRQDSPYDRPEKGTRSGNKLRSVAVTQGHQITRLLYQGIPQRCNSMTNVKRVPQGFTSLHTLDERLRGVLESFRGDFHLRTVVRVHVTKLRIGSGPTRDGVSV